MDGATQHISRTAQIAQQLRDDILSGQYRSGERLPSERDLCERFQVSRGAVREALKQLDQLGIVSIQHGGARVVPVEECTLDVLGPLLDLNEFPDTKLVDEVMQTMGVLMREAAGLAIVKASDEQLAEAVQILDAIVAAETDPVGQFESVRRLGQFFVEVADHLVLRLMINGLKTSFMDRMTGIEAQPMLDSERLKDPIARIRQALSERNSEELGVAMQDLNRLFRDSAHESLVLAADNRTRKSG